MKQRIWYPQLDVYDAVRRHLMIGSALEQPISSERFFVADFYLANPPLLYRTSMPSEVREKFYKLSIDRPEKSFLSFPPPPLLFQKMEPIQRQSVQELVGRGLLDTESLKRGQISVTDDGRGFYVSSVKPNLSDDEAALVSFLTQKFVSIGDDGIQELRRRTGLRGHR